jgi:hypothetical protein
MKVLVVTSFDIPSAEALPEILLKMDPPSLPYFDNEVRVVPDPENVKAIIKWLDEG